MTKKTESGPSLWKDIDAYEDGVDDSYKCADLSSYERRDDEYIAFLKNFVLALGKLPSSTELVIKMAANSIDEYSESYVDVGNESCRVVSRCSINGSTVLGYSTAQELIKALKEANYNPQNLKYTYFAHYEGENGSIENTFHELGGGYGEYEVVSIADADQLSEEEIATVSDFENCLNDRSTVGVAFFEVSDVKIFVETSMLKKAKLL